MRADNQNIGDDKIIEKISQYIDITVTPFGKSQRSVVRVDKRDPMYDGTGVVYLLQMFGAGELINNRIGAYMVLPNKNDCAGFHTHQDRSEQEIYVVMHGQGEYLDKAGKDGKTRKQKLIKGSIAVVNDDGFHSVKNISDEPLIIFVITTNNPKN